MIKQSSHRRALVISLLLVVLASIVGLGWALDHLYKNVTNPETTDDISIYRTFSSELAVAINSTSDPSVFVANWPEESGIPISLQPRDNFPLPSEMSESFESGEALVLESEQGISIHYYLPAHSQVLTVTPLDTKRDNVPLLQRVLTTAFYGGILSLMLIWLYPLLRRLKQLRSSAIDFGAGNLETRINTSGISYIADIENEFNNMAHRIQTLVEDNKLLSSAVSHDLRTPLARLRFGMGTLADAKNPDDRERYLNRINNDLDEMENLVNSLLKFSRLDHSLNGIDKTQINITQMIDELLAQFHDERFDTQISSNDHQAMIYGSTEYIAMLVNNLLQNASHYAEKRINVQIIRSNKSIQISVSDDGPGIPLEMRSDVVKPFTKGQKDAQAPQGYGLGLAIVSRIAHWHKANINIDDCPDLYGARISIEFFSTNITNN